MCIQSSEPTNLVSVKPAEQPIIIMKHFINNKDNQQNYADMRRKTTQKIYLEEQDARSSGHGQFLSVEVIASVQTLAI